MTIENSLERIAVALETIVASIPSETGCTCAKAEAPVETPKKKPLKISAKG